MITVNVDVRPHNHNGRGGEPKKYKDKIYIHVANESILENLIKRTQRPYQFYKKIILPKVFDSIKATHPHLYDQIRLQKWGWSQSCGCSMCPCSPGFIGDGENNATDIFVKVNFEKTK